MGNGIAEVAGEILDEKRAEHKVAGSHTLHSFDLNKFTVLFHWPSQSQFLMPQLHRNTFPWVLIRDIVDKFPAGENGFRQHCHQSQFGYNTTYEKKYTTLLVLSFFIIPETQLRHAVV